jgi:hypothetical protein
MPRRVYRKKTNQKSTTPTEKISITAPNMTHCDFCGKVAQIYWDPKDTWATICLTCAQKAVSALLDSKDQEVIEE